MNTLVLGGKSAVASTLKLYPGSEKYLFLNRDDCEKLIEKMSEFGKYIEQNEIDKVIYLMVDRSTNHDEVFLSKINHIYPLEIFETLLKFEYMSFIWPSSIFCKDEAMVQSHPYLGSQNLAFENMKARHEPTVSTLARIYLPQIYGSEDYRKHQPFLYKVRDLIRTQEDVLLTNGNSTFRNFVHEYDVARILADSRNWVDQVEVECLVDKNASWLEIVESIRIAYSSNSRIHDQIDETVKLPEYKYSRGDLVNIAKRYDLMSFEQVIEMEMF